MKTILLYGRRNPCWMVLNYLIARGFKVKILTDDYNVRWLAGELNCEIVADFGGMGQWDLFLCVHGQSFVPVEYFGGRTAVNIHPTKYNGHNPVKKFIHHKDTIGSLRAMHMAENIDEGELIAEEIFETGICHEYADYYNVAFPFYIRLISKVLEKIL